MANQLVFKTDDHVFDCPHGHNVTIGAIIGIVVAIILAVVGSLLLYKLVVKKKLHPSTNARSRTNGVSVSTTSSYSRVQDSRELFDSCVESNVTWNWSENMQNLHLTRKSIFVHQFNSLDKFVSKKPHKANPSRCRLCFRSCTKLINSTNLPVDFRNPGQLRESVFHHQRFCFPSYSTILSWKTSRRINASFSNKKALVFFLFFAEKTWLPKRVA